MTSSSFSRVLAFVAVLLWPCLLLPTGTAAAGSFLRAEAESEILMSAKEILNKPIYTHPLERLATIQADIRAAVLARPTHVKGRLPLEDARDVIADYFAKEHGWLFRGLEPVNSSPTSTKLREVAILREKAPVLAGALLGDKGEHGRGLSLGELAAVAAVIERLTLDESRTLLGAAYALNGRSLSNPVEEKSLHELLESYLLIYRQGATADLTDPEKHEIIKARAQEPEHKISWKSLEDFAAQAITGHDSAPVGSKLVRRSPKTRSSNSYSFAEAAEIVDVMAVGYGKWQNAECRAMKVDLMNLDPLGTGRVPLSVFNAQPTNPAYGYQFTESAEYLRRVGALEESPNSAPDVIIANYLVGPSNCIASSAYYAVCCLDECENLMSTLQGQVQAPAELPDRLLELVSDLSSASVAAPRALPKALSEELHLIAGHHGGVVPLFGANFAHWMHRVYPNECPVPQVSETEVLDTESSEGLQLSRWLDDEQCTRVPVYMV